MDEGSSGRIGMEFVPEKDPEFIRDRLKVVFGLLFLCFSSCTRKIGDSGPSNHLQCSPRSFLHCYIVTTGCYIGTRNETCFQTTHTNHHHTPRWE